MNRLYNADMMAGRPQTKETPEFGRRLSALRRSKGWSQTELAAALNTTQKMVDYYERRAQIGDTAAPARASRKAGPTGKVQKAFEDVSRLPRRQQEHIVKVVSALVSQYEQSRQ
jgi:hypothetical protein